MKAVVASPSIIIEAIQTARQARLAEESLYEFVKAAWPVIEPGVPFIDSFHIRTICDHLEAVHRGQIQKLLINIPPRHSKSTIVSILYPAWTWIRRPSDRILSASYAASLAIKDAMASRRVIQSDWYQRNWGDRFSFMADSNAKTRFDNDSQGYRIITSTGAATTGFGGNLLLLDDPHGAMDAQSDAMRVAATDWFNQAWSTRLNNPKTDAMVTIMQRLHMEDVSGIILEQGGWEHVCIPAEFDGVRRSTVLGAYDPRKKKGELICPERFGPAELDNLKRNLGEYGASGQLAQMPSPAGGGILKTDHFQLWPSKKDIPVMDFVIQSVDCAYTEKTSGDPSACTVWGMFNYGGQRCAILLDVWEEHLPYPKLRQKLIDEWHSEYGGSVETGVKPRKADVLLVEAKASGMSIIQDLRMGNIPAVAFNPTTDKVNRAHRIAPILELDVLYIPESNKFPGQFITWAQDFVKQVSMFPVAKRDDMTDTFSQAMIFLSEGGHFDMPRAYDDEYEVDYESKRKARVNPYAC